MLIKYQESIIKTEDVVKEISLEELVDYIIDQEGDYFLQYDDNELYEEFYSLTCDLVEHESVLEENKEEILRILNAKRETIDKENYAMHVEDLVDFLEETYKEDFIESTEYPLYEKDMQKMAFKEAVERIYKKYFKNEKKVE